MSGSGAKFADDMGQDTLFKMLLASNYMDVKSLVASAFGMRSRPLVAGRLLDLPHCSECTLEHGGVRRDAEGLQGVAAVSVHFLLHLAPQGEPPANLRFAALCCEYADAFAALLLLLC